MTTKAAFRAIAILLFIVIGLTDAAGQTCRIKSGHTPSGVVSYMEVYEYDYVPDKPQFPGGDCKFTGFINSHRQYPQEAYDNGIQGRVVCSFVVNSDGSVSHIEVLKGVCYELNQEAMRVLSLMPDWIPGRLHDTPVPVRVIKTIPFRRK